MSRFFATVSLSSGYHLQSNGQTEQLNQELETGLRCLVSRNPATWSKHFIWVEYAHNTLPCSFSELSPFQCAYGYQPPLFPELETEVRVPSAQALIRRSRRVWSRVRQMLLRSSGRSKRMADRQRIPAPSYRPGQRVWLSTRNLPLHVESYKLAPQFVGPLPVTPLWLQILFQTQDKEHEQKARQSRISKILEKLWQDKTNK